MSDTSSFQLQISGDMTIYEAAELQDLLKTTLAENDSVQVDLINVNEIDSSGVQLMVAAKKQAVIDNKNVQFVGHSQAVIGLLDLLDMTAYLGDPIVMESSAS